MFFSTSILAAALLGFAAATEHAKGGMMSSKASAAQALSTGVPAGMVSTHVVQVGGPNGSLIFSPNNVIAAPGDLVQFQFHPKNHSVVQSTFDKPCIPIQNVMPNKTDAFFSGYMPTNASLSATSQILTYTIRVTDKKPVWFYCSQAKHCQGGMVGAINAPATGNKTVDTFLQLAAAAPENLSPGQKGGSGSPPSGPSAAPPSAPGNGTGSSPSSSAPATGSSLRSPPQQTANVAPSRLSDTARQSFFGLGLGGIAAFLVL